jgi:alkylated DNA repair dioxygenase AlkB
MLRFPAAPDRLERLQIPDADLSYASAIDLGAPADALLRTLIDTIPWRSESIVLWGRTYAQPRLIAWFGDQGKNYTYSGLTLVPLPWTALLTQIRQRVELLTTVQFNSVLLNYYRDGNDSMGMHSDDEPELGPNPVIASLSLGEERTFILRHRTKKQLQPLRLPLASGSLLLMQGETQEHWKHGIEKENGPCGPRVNLNFRRIVRG